jgi:hypothetical protein
VCVIFVHVLRLSDIWSLSYVAHTLSKFGHPWPIGFVMPVRPSVCMLSVRLLLDGFSWNLILKTSTKICRETHNLVKVGQQYRALHIRPKHVRNVYNSTKYFSSRQQCTGNPFLRFHGEVKMFCTVDSYMGVNNNTKGPIVAFPWQQWLCERAAILRYTYIACPVNFTSRTSSWNDEKCDF